jgi:Flp pilus assembly protein TadG
MRIRKHVVFEKIRRFVRRENGTHMVELAIALPLMLVMLGGLAEFGRFFYTYTTLTNAVRAGARHACKWEKSASWTFPETANMVVYGSFSGGAPGTEILPGLSTSNVAIQANGPSVNNVDSVTVKIVNYTYQPLFDLGKLTGISALSLSIDMNASATMHQLYNGPTAG